MTNPKVAIVIIILIEKLRSYAYMINIASIDESKDISMREVYGLDKNLVE